MFSLSKCSQTNFGPTPRPTPTPQTTSASCKDHVSFLLFTLTRRARGTDTKFYALYVRERKHTKQCLNLLVFTYIVTKYLRGFWTFEARRKETFHPVDSRYNLYPHMAPRARPTGRNRDLNLRVYIGVPGLEGGWAAVPPNSFRTETQCPFRDCDRHLRPDSGCPNFPFPVGQMSVQVRVRVDVCVCGRVRTDWCVRRCTCGRACTDVCANVCVWTCVLDVCVWTCVYGCV